MCLCLGRGWPCCGQMRGGGGGQDHIYQVWSSTAQGAWPLSGVRSPCRSLLLPPVCWVPGQFCFFNPLLIPGRSLPHVLCLKERVAGAEVWAEVGASKPQTPSPAPDPIACLQRAPVVTLGVAKPPAAAGLNFQLLLLRRCLPNSPSVCKGGSRGGPQHEREWESLGLHPLPRTRPEDVGPGILCCSCRAGSLGS